VEKLTAMRENQITALTRSVTSHPQPHPASAAG
jgi:hypothetical protein